MKTLFFLTVIIIASQLSISQNMGITYNITKDHKISSGNKTITLNYIGYLYKKSNRYVYFEKPAYKQKIENGTILISDNGSNSIYSLTVDTDSLQCIVYSNFDSLEQRMSKFDATKRTILNDFEADWQSWNLLPDTMQINGLHCQKATHTDVNGNLEWVVWFCPDIHVKSGVHWLKNLPGLVTDAQWIPLNKHYTLATYTTVNEIPDAVFWPNEFNVPVKKGIVLRNLGVRKPAKAEKRNEIINSNQ
ncbi:MAG: GLPGLI family protein [Ferruginibacter sp.]